MSFVYTLILYSAPPQTEALEVLCQLILQFHMAVTQVLSDSDFFFFFHKFGGMVFL